MPQCGTIPFEGTKLTRFTRTPSSTWYYWTPRHTNALFLDARKDPENPETLHFQCSSEMSRSPPNAFHCSCKFCSGSQTCDKRQNSSLFIQHTSPLQCWRYWVNICKLSKRRKYLRYVLDYLGSYSHVSASSYWRSGPYNERNYAELESVWWKRVAACWRFSAILSSLAIELQSLNLQYMRHVICSLSKLQKFFDCQKAWH